MTGITESKDDIVLSTYIDGELPENDVRVLRERLSREPELAARLETLRSADSDALRASSAIDQRPMPQGVLDLLGQGEKAAESGKVIAFPKRTLAPFFQMPVAIAASVALVAGFLLSDLLGRGDIARPETTGLYAGRVELDSDLHRILERGSSDMAHSLADGQDVNLLLTFQDHDGNYCRQLQVQGATSAVQGVACRRSAGWQVEAIGIAAAPAPDGSYQQAAGDTPAAIESAIDGLIGDLPPLDVDEEKSIISMSWKKSEN